jgi:uncharacterized protein (TIGR00251 family)
MGRTPAWRPAHGGILLALRVTPNAGVDRIEGVETRDDGAAVLRVRVRAIPDKGKANAAVIALIAGALGVPRSAIALTAGETSRQKTLRIAGDAETLGARLAALAANGD